MYTVCACFLLFLLLSISLYCVVSVGRSAMGVWVRALWHICFCSTSVRCDVEGRIGVVALVAVNIDVVIADESVLTNKYA